MSLIRVEQSGYYGQRFIEDTLATSGKTLQGLGVSDLQSPSLQKQVTLLAVGHALDSYYSNSGETGPRVILRRYLPMFFIDWEAGPPGFVAPVHRSMTADLSEEAQRAYVESINKRIKTAKDTEVVYLLDRMVTGL